MTDCLKRSVSTAKNYYVLCTIFVCFTLWHLLSVHPDIKLKTIITLLLPTANLAVLTVRINNFQGFSSGKECRIRLLKSQSESIQTFYSHINSGLGPIDLITVETKTEIVRKSKTLNKLKSTPFNYHKIRTLGFWRSEYLKINIGAQVDPYRLNQISLGSE